VLLLHGWPDSSYLWRHQIPFLVANGFRAIAPDLRGFGRSDRPEGVAAYSLLNAVADAVGLLDALGIDAADIVAHDWGAGVAWLTATARPNRVRRLVVLSVPHPLAPYTLRQREMAWYQLFFQFEGIAEAWLQHDNWALFREMLRGNGDVDRYISDLSRPDALKASLNWYRANLAPRLPKSLPKLPSLKAPTLGIWSSNDHYLDAADPDNHVDLSFSADLTRGLASLRVQANEIGLDEAGHFHAAWTPRGWSDASSRLVGFEQLLYLRQPGYGPSYIVGKLDLDHLLALAAHRADLDRKPFDNRAAFAAIFASGIVPPAIIEDEMAEALSGR